MPKLSTGWMSKRVVNRRDAEPRYFQAVQRIGAEGAELGGENNSNLCVSVVETNVPLQRGLWSC